MEDKIFKTYDIRGLSPEELDKETAYLVGRGFVSFLDEENPEIVVGRDARKTSPALFKELKRGLIDSGATVFDIGVATTPLLNFAVCKYSHSGGVMVTASHNPPEYNGLKLIKENGLQVYGKGIKKIKNLIKKEKFKKGNGSVEKKDPLPDYISHILSFVDHKEDLKVVVDYGNGVASVTGKEVFKNIKAEVVSLYEDLDPAFPNHLPNPEPKNMEELINKVKEEKADLGVFFDGDGDRAFFVDEKGEIVYPDLIISLLAQKELKKSKEKKVYFDLRFSKITPEKVSESGGIPEMMRVGNPFYKEKLVNEGGLMGAELSGHIMHKDNYCIDDGLFIAIKMISFLGNVDKTLSELTEPLKIYYQSEEINMEVDDKDKALERAREAFPEGFSINLDGVYIDFDNWWFNLRKSNTEDVVRLRLEAESKKLLEEKTEELVSLIKES
ncbi:MAG: phosphomannomutase/phosphoglucomutase [Patescibacteria group bacterium]